MERAYHYSTYFFVVLSIEQQDTILKHQFEMEWPRLDITWRVLLTFLLCNLLDNNKPLLKNQFEMKHLIVDAATTEVESAGGLEGNLERI